MIVSCRPWGHSAEATTRTRNRPRPYLVSFTNTVETILNAQRGKTGPKSQTATINKSSQNIESIKYSIFFLFWLVIYNEFILTDRRKRSPSGSPKVHGWAVRPLGGRALFAAEATLQRPPGRSPGRASCAMGSATVLDAGAWEGLKTQLECLWPREVWASAAGLLTRRRYAPTFLAPY